MTDNADIAAAREAFINAASAEVEATELEAAPADTVEPQGGAAETPAPDAAKPAPESEARAYRKLLDGEAKLRAERKAYEAERVAHETELKEYRATKAKLAADPVGFLKAAGLTEAQILETIQEAQARDLGKLAPPEVRAQLAAKHAERVARESEERIEAKLKADADARAAAETDKYVQQYQAGITEFVSNQLTSYPELSRVHAAGKPVAQAIFQTALEMASADPSGPPPTYAAVAAQLNAQLAELASVVASSPAPTPAVTADPTTPAPKPVLRNSSTQAQPSPSSDSKPQSYKEYTEQLRQKVLATYGVGR